MSEKSRNPKYKTIIYLIVIIVCFVCVFIQIGLVKRDRAKTIVSFVEEWARRGKPVTVEKIVAQDVPVYAKITARVVADELATGYVTADIQEKLQVGQEVFHPKKQGPCGKIKSIARDLDLDTGMFPVEIDLNFAPGLGKMAVIFVRTSVLPNTMVVPNEILENSGGEYYLWKVLDGKANKVKVKIGSRNGYGTAIIEGIKPGDMIVYNGRDLLLELDKVDIVSNKASEEINIKGRSL